MNPVGNYSTNPKARSILSCVLIEGHKFPVFLLKKQEIS